MAKLKNRQAIKEYWNFARVIVSNWMFGAGFALWVSHIADGTSPVYWIGFALVIGSFVVEHKPTRDEMINWATDRANRAGGEE